MAVAPPSSRRNFRSIMLSLPCRNGMPPASCYYKNQTLKIVVLAASGRTVVYARFGCGPVQEFSLGNQNAALAA